MIKESRATKGEMVASTIRMPKETNSFIEELAEHLLLSKQEVMLKLIEEGVRIAESELNIYTEGENCKFHLLNTNRRHDVNDHDDMMTNEIAAAFYDPWKHNIDRINKDDIVFLYENGVGIVAFGKATGKLEKKDKHGDKDECHYQKLTDFRVLKKPITAAETKKILNRNVVFLRTMSGMPDGQKILNKITGK
jgi:hypothetical protein